MGRSLEARIKRAAHKVVRRERELDQAEQKYRELLDEADRRGVPTPRTILTNPLLPPRRRTDW
jgi:hypothetical protein